MSYIKFDDSKLKKFVNDDELPDIQPMVTAADEELRKGTGAGSDMRGFLNLPNDYDKEEFDRIKKAADKIKSDSDVLVVIGIGGSYLGAKMAVDFINGEFYNSKPKDKRKGVKVVFAGNSLSAPYIHELLDYIGDQDFSINMISKSGTTTEPAIAFRIFKEKLIKKYGEAEANKRIYATTDARKGALRKEADTNGYESFVIPDNVGGRYSVLTPVGLLPIAATGANISQLMKGAADASKDYVNADVNKNDAYRYAALRNVLYRKGFNTELIENYEPNMRMFSEWWKQLMGESEGKDQKGIYPSSANFTTDLHSLGQYIQQGLRDLIETVVKIDKPRYNMDIPKEEDNLDGLKYLQDDSVDQINSEAYKAVVLAHTNGGVPVMTVHLPDQSEYSLGYLIYFFEIAVAISGYLNAINPFNQPGVEEYKDNMYALLGKPGYEDLQKKIEDQLD